MAELQDYSGTAASNNSASPAGWPEGMAPSGVNNSDRELAARIARERDDTQGVTATAGSANAYTLAALRDTAAAYTGEMFLVRFNFTNTGAATINITPAGGAARGAVTIQKNGAALIANDAVSGGIGLLVYDGTQYQLLAATYFTTAAGTVLDDTTVAAMATTLGVPTYAQIQNQTHSYAVAAGTANALTLDLTPNLGTYADGQMVAFKGASANTAAATMAIDGQAAIAIQVGGRALIRGEIQVNGIYLGIIRDVAGTNTLQLLGDGDIVAYTPTITFATAGDLSVVYDEQVGFIGRLGNMLFVFGEISTSTFTHTTASGALRISTPVAMRAVTGGVAWPGSLGRMRGITKANFTHFAPVWADNSAWLNITTGGSAQVPDSISTGDMPTGGTQVLLGWFVMAPVV